MRKKRIGIIIVVLFIILLLIAGWMTYKMFFYKPDTDDLITDEDLEKIMAENVVPVEPEEDEPDVVVFDPGEEETGEAKIGGTYSVVVLTADVYDSQDYRAHLIAQLAGGTQFTVLEDCNAQYRIEMKNGREGYIDKRDVAEGVWYAKLNGAIDLRELLPDAEIDMLFASYKNIVGEPMYPAIPLMEYNTAMMLKNAYDWFIADGYTIRVCDAYRPKSAQYKLYDLVEDTRFIANPYNGNSWHQLGRAIDMSLIKLDTGEEIDTPTAMHTFDVRSARYSSSKWTEQQRADVDYMTHVMTECGFKTISTEWWHFENNGSGPMLSPNPDYNEIKFVRAA